MNISTSHLNNLFNEEIQVDFIYSTVHGNVCEILNLIDVGTRYGQRVVK